METAAKEEGSAKLLHASFGLELHYKYLQNLNFWQTKIRRPKLAWLRQNSASNRNRPTTINFFCISK